MSTNKIGLSSGTMPKLSATELAKIVLDNGGNTVDLRTGKGHLWEAEGLQPFRESGMHVAFIGLSVVLGDERWNEKEILRAGSSFVGYPLRVFAKIGSSEEAFSKHQVEILAELAGSPENVLLETHHGYSSIDELITLHKETEAHILLDTMGLARISTDPMGDSERISTLVRAVQVKGFDWAQPNESRHIPLVGPSLDKTITILQQMPANTPVTVETRTASGIEDMAILRSILLT